MYQVRATKVEGLAKSPLAVEHRLPPKIPKGIVIRPGSLASPPEAATAPEATVASAGPSSKATGKKRGKE